MYEFDKRSLNAQEMYFWLCQMARQLDSAVVLINPKKGHSIEFVNQVFSRMTEYSEAEMIGNTLSRLNGPLTDFLNEEAIQESIENGLTFKTSSFHYRKDGSVFWNEISILPMRDQNGKLQYSLLMMNDVTEAMNIDALIELERDVYFSLENGGLLEDVLGNICHNVALAFGKKCHCSILLIDTKDHSLHFYGDFATELKELNNQGLLMNMSADIGKFLKKPVIVKDIKQSIYSEIYKQLIEEHHLKSLWGQPILNAEGKIIGFFSMYFEQQAEPQAVDFKFLNSVAPIVTLAIKYFEQKNAIRRLAYQDVTTGLNNLEQFKKMMNGLIEHDCERHLYIVEPGEYQKIIDLYGRQGGDEILRQLASRFESHSMYKDSLMARYTNSALIIASRFEMKDIGMHHPDIDKILYEPYYIDNKEVYITLKIGTAIFSQTNSLAEAIHQADTALSNALKSTGTVIKQFEKAQIESVEQEMNVLAHISKGLKNSEFFPVLQPKVNIQTGEIESFEALARWISKELGFVSPAHFIPVAESTGNIYKIDREILEKVLQWQQQRMETRLPLYQVSVNISPSHFYNPAFVESSVELIKQYGVQPKYIKFEITESMELDNVLRAKKIINELNQHGIATSIDDFGVGYSSLSYLQELPFEEIKIDKSFVDNLENPRMNAVIKTIIQLSLNLNMVSVAEGIETEEQHLELNKLGCLVGQGYYYYKPMPIEEINKLLHYNMSSN